MGKIKTQYAALSALQRGPVPARYISNAILTALDNQNAILIYNTGSGRMVKLRDGVKVTRKTMKKLRPRVSQGRSEDEKLHQRISQLVRWPEG